MFYLLKPNSKIQIKAPGHFYASMSTLTIKLHTLAAGTCQGPVTLKVRYNCEGAENFSRLVMMCAPHLSQSIVPDFRSMGMNYDPKLDSVEVQSFHHSELQIRVELFIKD